MPLPPALAALVVGLAMLLGLASLTIGAAWIAARPRATPRRVGGAGRDGGAAGRVAEAFGSRLAREAEAATEAHPYGAALVAFFSGLALGSSPEVQDIIKTALKNAGTDR